MGTQVAPMKIITFVILFGLQRPIGPLHELLENHSWIEYTKLVVHYLLGLAISHGIVVQCNLKVEAC